jgi:VanZ family protein
VAWAAMIFGFSTGTFTSSFSAWLLGEILRLLHVTVSPHGFAILHFLFRKLAHCTEYAIFCMFIYHCFLNSNRTEWHVKTAGLSVLVAGLYSLSDEFHQVFVPGRTASLIDCGIDTVGAMMGILGIFLWTRFFQTGGPRTEEEENRAVQTLTTARK